MQVEWQCPNYWHFWKIFPKRQHARQFIINVFDKSRKILVNVGLLLCKQLKMWHYIKSFFNYNPDDKFYIMKLILSFAGLQPFQIKADPNDYSIKYKISILGISFTLLNIAMNIYFCFKHYSLHHNHRHHHVVNTNVSAAGEHMMETSGIIMVGIILITAFRRQMKFHRTMLRITLLFERLKLDPSPRLKRLNRIISFLLFFWIVFVTYGMWNAIDFYYDAFNKFPAVHYIGFRAIPNFLHIYGSVVLHYADLDHSTALGWA